MSDLEAEARHASDRYRLYRAKIFGSSPTSPGRLRELQRTHVRAAARLRRARAGAAHLLASLPPRRAPAEDLSTTQTTTGDPMTEQITADQVVQAARDLGKDEFTREDLATKLGVEKSDIRPAFKEARNAGQLEKTRDDEENTGHFRLTA
jgi:hypothetical protein